MSDQLWPWIFVHHHCTQCQDEAGSAPVQLLHTRREKRFLAAAKSPDICTGTLWGRWVEEMLALESLFSLQLVKWVMPSQSWHKKLSDWSVRFFGSDILCWAKWWHHTHSTEKRWCCFVVRAIAGPNFLSLRKVLLETVTVKVHLMQKLLNLARVPNSQWA